MSEALSLPSVSIMNMMIMMMMTLFDDDIDEEDDNFYDDDNVDINCSDILTNS